MRALIIEDEETLRNNLASELQDKGYVTETACDGDEGLYLGREFPFDIAIIDLGLPKRSGIDVIKQLRAEDIASPILILTARDQWQDKVVGLEAGADDYLAKPFHMEELMARVNALIRRSGGWAKPVLSAGPISLDSLAQVVTVNGQSVELTAYEYKVLEYLMLNPSKVVSKTELTEHIYHQDYERDSNVIEVFVGRLRRKLDPEDSYKPIETVRGRGYRFALTLSSQEPNG